MGAGVGAGGDFWLIQMVEVAGRMTTHAAAGVTALPRDATLGSTGRGDRRERRR